MPFSLREIIARMPFFPSRPLVFQLELFTGCAPFLYYILNNNRKRGIAGKGPALSGRHYYVRSYMMIPWVLFPKKKAINKWNIRFGYHCLIWNFNSYCKITHDASHAIAKLSNISRLRSRNTRPYDREHSLATLQILFSPIPTLQFLAMRYSTISLECLFPIYTLYETLRLDFQPGLPARKEIFGEYSFYALSKRKWF